MTANINKPGHKIVGIVFDFENVESATVPIEDVKKFNIDNVSEDWELGSDGNLIKHYSAETVEIVFNTEHVKDEQTWANDRNGNPYMLPQRLVAIHDVANVGVLYDDDSQLTIGLSWNFRNEDKNLNQYAVLAKDRDGNEELRFFNSSNERYLSDWTFYNRAR